MDRSSRQKINKGRVDLNNTLSQLDLTEIYRLLHPTRAEYTCFPSSYGTFTKMDHVLGHTTNLKKYERIEIIQYVLSGHNGIKLEIITEIT